MVRLLLERATLSSLQCTIHEELSWKHEVSIVFVVHVIMQNKDATKRATKF